MMAVELPKMRKFGTHVFSSSFCLYRQKQTTKHSYILCLSTRPSSHHQIQNLRAVEVPKTEIHGNNVFSLSLFLSPPNSQRTPTILMSRLQALRSHTTSPCTSKPHIFQNPRKKKYQRRTNVLSPSCLFSQKDTFAYYIWLLLALLAIYISLFPRLNPFSMSN
jgi:hypothetical protein